MASGLPRRPSRPQEPPASSLVIRNIVVGSHRTSVRLEPMMWDALHDIAARRRMTLHALVTEIDRERTASSLTAAIRVHIVDYYRAAALHAAERAASGAAPDRRNDALSERPPETPATPPPGRRA